MPNTDRSTRAVDLSADRINFLEGEELMDHLSGEMVSAFAEQRASKEQLHVVFNHLPSCDTCRRRVMLATWQSSHDRIALLRQIAEGIFGRKIEPHLTDEQIVGWVRGTTLADERTDVTAHVASCNRCRRAVEDLRVFYKELTEE